MRWSLAVVALLGLGLIGGAQAATLTDPIEGTWTNSSGGKITISAAGATHFVGRVTVAYASNNGCSHPVGQTVWEIDKRGDGSYTGTNHGFASSACDGVPQSTTWKVSGTSLQACATGFACGTYTRPAASPAPAPAAAKPLSRLTVREVGSNVGVVYRPAVATVKNGAVITLCANQNFSAIPFSSLGRHNRFNRRAAGSYANGIPKGVRVLKRGTCMRLTARNPTKAPILFKIFDGIHSQARLVVTVLP